MFPGGAFEDARKQLVVSKIKTAKFIIKSGNKDYALEIINEGLMLEPGNKELLELKKKIARSGSSPQSSREPFPSVLAANRKKPILSISYDPGGRMDVRVFEEGSDRLVGMVTLGRGIAHASKTIAIKPGRYYVVAKVILPEGGQTFYKGAPFQIKAVSGKRAPTMLMFRDHGPEVRCMQVGPGFSKRSIFPLSLSAVEEKDFNR
jgi:hypothetical protein